jgi:hypothetical protein
MLAWRLIKVGESIFVEKAEKDQFCGLRWQVLASETAG